MLDYFEIGIITNTHGVKGEVKVLPLTDDPKRYDLLKEVYIENTQNKRTLYKIESVRYFKQFVLITFNGIDTMDKAQLLKDSKIIINRKDAVELPEDTYFIADLIDCSVYEDDIYLGKVYDVISTGSNDVYVVKDSESNKEILVPAIADVVKNVDVKTGRIDVELSEGLKDL